MAWSGVAIDPFEFVRRDGFEFVSWVDENDSLFNADAVMHRTYSQPAAAFHFPISLVHNVRPQLAPARLVDLSAQVLPSISYVLY